MLNLKKIIPLTALAVAAVLIVVQRSTDNSTDGSPTEYQSATTVVSSAKDEMNTEPDNKADTAQTDADVSAPPAAREADIPSSAPDVQTTPSPAGTAAPVSTTKPAPASSPAPTAAPTPSPTAPPTPAPTATASPEQNPGEIVLPIDPL